MEKARVVATNSNSLLVKITSEWNSAHFHRIHSYFILNNEENLFFTIVINANFFNAWYNILQT